MINTHLCLVSSQPIPNLAPVFESDQTQNSNLIRLHNPEND